jgi:hypothetical protein
VPVLNIAVAAWWGKQMIADAYRPGAFVIKTGIMIMAQRGVDTADEME